MIQHCILNSREVTASGVVVAQRTDTSALRETQREYDDSACCSSDLHSAAGLRTWALIGSEAARLRMGGL